MNVMLEKSVTTEHGVVYYWISNVWNDEKDTIFFFPGLTADHTMFEKQLSYFEGKYNLVTWDAPCHGKSRPYAIFSFEDTSKVIMEIMAENGIESIIGVGQSLGGYYIQALIARHPEKVKAFIGIGTSPYGEVYYSKSDLFWLRQVEWMGMCYPLKPLKKAVSKGATYTAEGYNNMMNMVAPYQKKEYCHLMQMAYSELIKDNRNLDIHCPVLITHGEYDKTGKVKQYCRMWHQQTGYPLVIIKNASHNANVDNPAEMNRVIEEFLVEKLMG